MFTFLEISIIIILDNTTSLNTGLTKWQISGNN